MHNAIPDSNMLDAATFHQRVQRLICDAGTDQFGHGFVRVGEVWITSDSEGLNVYLGPAGRTRCYSWKNINDRVQVTFRCELVRQAREALDRDMVLDALADA